MKIRFISLSALCCAALLILFTADIIYSSVNPNTGEGITTVSDKET